MDRQVGVIGLGIMGGAFARNLAAAGWEVHGYDPAPAARERLAEAGGVLHASPAEVGRAVPRLILSLPNPAVLEEVAESLAEVTEHPLHLAETSTLAPAAKEAVRARLEPHGHLLCDCPVSGTGAQAATGDIVVFASGPEAVLASFAEVWPGMSRRVVAAGGFGAGMQLKILANTLVTIHNAAAAETMAFARRMGLDLRTVYEALKDGAGGSKMFELRAPQMIEGVYQPPTATFTTHLKDLEIIERAAAAERMPMALFATSAQLYRAAGSMGLEHHDTASLCEVIGTLAGMPNRAAKG